ncbi:MAG: long-chain fatty acid--CoA ligase, partial [Actinobacteria bacterium]|nr:long-chain fatty acid--CoA ligase [Actinomycetota bacterium]
LAPAGIAYTSGTTGRPKGAVHSQHNLMLPGSVLVQSRDYKPDLRKGDCFAFTILNMAVLTTLLVSQAGGTSIVMDRTDPEGITDWIKREKITTWNGAPAMLHSLVTSDSVTANDLLTLDEVWVGGADCPDAIRRAFYTKFGLPVLATYGLSEAPTVIAIDDRPSSRSHKPVAPVGSSGKPLPHLRIRIVGADGSTLQQGEAGQICISAADDRYRTMLGYLNSPEATNDVIVDHELRTGDVGLIDENGYLHIRDRLSLVIIRGGANIYPAEIERVVAEFPGINASAAVGLPDERLGERVALLIELSDGAHLNDQELVTHLAENLARYKIPEQIKVIDAFPRNAMGKIQRRGLVDYFTDATR